MSKFVKSISLLGAALALVVAGITPANAAGTPTLTSTQFLASAGYLEFLEAAKTGAAYSASQSGQELQMTTSMNVGGTETVVSTVNIQATKTRAKIETSLSGQTVTMLIIDDSFYVPGTLYSSLFGPQNVDKAMSALPGSYGKTVKMTNVPADYESLKPAELFDSNAATQTELLNQSLSELMSLFTFTEVSKTVNPADATKTDYSFTMSMNFLGSTTTAEQTYTLDSHSMIVAGLLKVTGTSGSSTVTSTLALTSTINNILVINDPDPATIINEAVITQKSYKFTAQDKSLTKAKALVKKAGELAKKAKASVSSKHLTDAAKALKYTVSKITNGVKLTTAVSGVSGSVCVTTVKGKTSTKTC